MSDKNCSVDGSALPRSSVVDTGNSDRSRWLVQLLVAAAILAGLVAVMVIPGGSGIPLSPSITDLARRAAWEENVAPHLAAADHRSDAAAEKHAKRVREFFAERRSVAREFAEEALSWSGKWVYVKSNLPWTDADSYDRFLREAFERHIFKDEDIANLIKSTVIAYASELAGIENETLLAIRADLSDSELAQQPGMSALRSDEAFRQTFAKLIEQVVPLAARDVNVTAGREIASFIAADIAATITLDILAALGVRMGIEGGILSSGVAAGAATLGIGLVGAILADMALDWVLKKAGYDAAGEIAAKVCDSLSTVETLLLDGDQNGKGGLCHEFARLHEQRFVLRRAALQKLIWEGGAQ